MVKWREGINEGIEGGAYSLTAEIRNSIISLIAIICFTRTTDKRTIKSTATACNNSIKSLYRTKSISNTHIVRNSRLSHSCGADPHLKTKRSIDRLSYEFIHLDKKSRSIKAREWQEFYITMHILTFLYN